MRAMLPLAIGVALFPLPARAQTATPPAQAITEGAQIEEAARRTTGALDRVPADPLASDGEGGVYLLDTRPVFFVGGNAGAGYQSNPLRSADNTGGSGTFDANLTLGARLKLGGLVDVTASADVAGTKYVERSAPSNTVTTGSLAVGLPLRRTPFYLGAVAFGGFNFDEFFGRNVSFWGGSAFLGATLPLAPGLIAQPSVVASRQKTRISENDTKSVAARLAVTAVHGRLAATVSGGATRVWFDNFYEDVTFVERRDWQYDGGFGFTYQLTPALSLTAGARYVKRSSTFDLASFTSVDSRASLGIVRRF